MFVFCNFENFLVLSVFAFLFLNRILLPPTSSLVIVQQIQISAAINKALQVFSLISEKKKRRFEKNKRAKEQKIWI